LRLLDGIGIGEMLVHRVLRFDDRWQRETGSDAPDQGLKCSPPWNATGSGGVDR
jgi:hypothetical protein